MTDAGTPSGDPSQLQPSYDPNGWGQTQQPAQPQYQQPPAYQVPQGPPPQYAQAYGHSGYPSPTPGIVIAPGTRMSTRGRRFGAAVLDAVLVFVTLAIGYIIWTLVVWGQGQTPGKQLLGMRVIDARTGRAATWGAMFVRDFLVKGLLGNITFGLFGLIGALMIFGDTRQCAWDKMCHTAVVDDPNRVTLAR